MAGGVSASSESSMFSILRGSESELLTRTGWVPLEIAVHVETQVDTDEGISSHGFSLSPGDAQLNHFPPSPPPSLTRNIAMTLPRANYDPRRVCLNPFPEFTLGKHKRTVGVYLAGALVGGVL